jgi:hypothetical protein
MRKLLVAAAAGASVLGGAMIAQPLQAQPYGYYRPAPPYYAYHYDSYGRRYFEDADGRHYTDDRPYDAPAIAGSVLGPAFAEGYADVPYDRYGPDPNGMIARDGHRIKCKLQDVFDDRYGGYLRRRVCD